MLMKATFSITKTPSVFTSFPVDHRLKSRLALVPPVQLQAFN